jgi:hypothetical protein
VIEHAMTDDPWCCDYHHMKHARNVAIQERDEARLACAGMVYLYDRFGFDQSVRSTTDPMLEWINMILLAKKVAAHAEFTPPKDCPVATAFPSSEAQS